MEQISRREFLKTFSCLSCAIIFNKPLELLKEYENKYFENIFSYIKNTIINMNNIAEINGNQVTVIQTGINKINIELARNNPYFKCDYPNSIVFHSFDATDYILDTYMPNRTAQEYVEQGFANNTSARFLIGNEKFDIVQCEINTPDGFFVPSAHCVEVDRINKNKNHYLQTLLNMCYKFDKDKTLSEMNMFYTNGHSSSPNCSSIGIEITGCDFDKEFPTDNKIANALSLTIALVKKYHISPAFGFFGHKELDMHKNDPGKRLVYLMKLLIGIYSLFNNDVYLKNIVFKGFENYKEYFDFITEYFITTSDLQEANDYLNKIKYYSFVNKLSTSEFLTK
jgi:hypothetical protein